MQLVFESLFTASDAHDGSARQANKYNNPGGLHLNG